MPRVGHAERDKPSGLAETINAWREDAGRDGRPMSLTDLAYEARKYGASAALDGSQLSKVLGGKRPYDEALLEALARALGHDPEDLPHYRLAAARQQLDERTVGLELALTHYEQIITALRQSAVQRSATTRLQREQRRQAQPASLVEALNEQART